MILSIRWHRLYCLKLALVFSLLCAVGQALANQRLALVVGIDNYDNVSALQKANNDAFSVLHSKLRSVHQQSMCSWVRPLQTQ